MTLETAYVDVASLELRAEGDRHELEGICVPYDSPTTKAGPRPEVFRRGAFRDVSTASLAKIRLLDNNHSPARRPVGVAAALEERQAGLWGRFRFYNTPEGRAAFENVQEGTYGGLSIGFMAKGEEVRDGIRNVLHAWLDHVSLVDSPAYDEARIVAVRDAGPDLSQWEWMKKVPTAIDIEPASPLTLLMSRPRR